MSVNTKIIAKNSSGKGGTTIIRTVGGGGDFSTYDGSTIPQLNVDTLNVNNIEAAVTNSSTIVAGNIDTSNINSNTAEITELANQLLTVSERITTGAIKGSFGEIDKVKAEEIVTQFLETDTIKSKDIITDNLTVLGSAHFFELVLDKIKSVGGAVILSPADGFELYAYNPGTGSGVRLIWRADKDTQSRANMWQVDDQALCQNFNQASAGTSQNVSNTFCWARVVYKFGSKLNIWRRAFNDPVEISGTVYDNTHPIWRKGDFFAIDGIMYINTTDDIVKDDTVIDARTYELLDPSEQINYEEYSTAYGRVDPDTGTIDYVTSNAYNGTQKVSYNVSNYYIREYCKVDVVKCHAIIISQTDCAPNSTFTFNEGDNFVQLGNRTDTTRQNAIYLSSYASLDADLKPPFMAQYTGINEYDLTSHKYTWFAGGSNTTSVPANNIRGNVVMSSGTPYKDYVDDSIDDALGNIMVDQFTVELDTNNFFVPAQNQSPYYILGNSTFTTNIALYNNGAEWSMNNAPTTTVSGVTFTPNDGRPAQAPHYKYLITIDAIQIGSWYGINPITIPITINFYDNSSPQKTFTRTVNIYLNKLIQGADGSATAVAFGMYELVPRNEEINVNENGVLGLNLRYSLGSVNVQSDGTTTIDPLTTWPSSLSVTMRHDKMASVDPDIVFDNETISGVIKNKKYVSNAFISDYFSLLDTPNNCPTYFTIYLKNNGNVIQQKIIPIMMNGGATFKLNDNSISAAVSQSKTYTDGKISDVNGNISDLNDSLTTTNSNVSQLRIDVNGIQTNVSSLQTTVSNQGTLINQKVDQSTFDQTSQSITSRVSSCETDINNLDADLNNNYYTKNETDSEIGQAKASINNNLSNNYYTRTQTQTQIDQTASTISATVESNISGQLRQTGINIEDGVISLNSENTNINGNLNINEADVGLVLYDDGNPVIKIMNDNITSPENTTEILENYNYGEAEILGTWDLTTEELSLGSRKTGEVLTLVNFRLDTSAYNGAVFEYPNSNTLTLTVYIKNTTNNTIVSRTNNIICTKQQGTGGVYINSDTQVTYRIETDANYSVFYAQTIPGQPSGRAKTSARAYISYTTDNITKIGKNGLLSNPAANCYTYSCAREQTMRMGVSGIRVINNEYCAGVQVLNSYRNWHNYNNVRQVKYLNEDSFTSGTVYYNGSAPTVKRYVIDPNEGYSTYVVTSTTSDANLFIVLPDTYPTTTKIGDGYNIKIIKFVYSSDEIPFNLYVCAESSSEYIQDGNNNSQKGVQLNTNPHSSNFMSLPWGPYTYGSGFITWIMDQDANQIK